MFVGVVGAAAPTAEAYQILIMSLVTVAAVIGLPVLLVVLIWRAASQSAQQRRQSQAADQAAAAAAAASEQAAREAFLKPYLEWTDHSYSLFDKSFIAIDLSGRQIAVGVVGRATKYPFEAITAVDVVKDGGVQIGRAHV